jgi:hypothetical protein
VAVGRRSLGSETFAQVISDELMKFRQRCYLVTENLLFRK